MRLFCRHAQELNLLVAFGGYNGKYHNTVSVYKLAGQEEPEQLQKQQKEELLAQQQVQQTQSKPLTPAKQQQQQQQQTVPGARKPMDKGESSPYRTQSTPPTNSREGAQRGGNASEAPVANGNASLVSTAA